VYRVECRNRTYSGAETKGFTFGDKIGAATLSPCDDTSNSGDGQTAPASAPPA
jgi:hypothetical protein